MSLGKKIWVAFLAIILMIFIICISVIQFILRPSYRQHSENEILQFIETKASETGAWLGTRISEVRVLHENPACRTLNMKELKGVVTPLNNMLQQNYGNIGETIAIGGLNGLGWVSNTITIDVSKRDYFKKAMTGDHEYVISVPVISKSDSMDIFLICYPIRDSSDNIIGFINTSVNLESFSKRIHNIDLYSGLPFLINREGVIYTPDSSILYQNNLSSSILKNICKNIEENNAGKLDMKNINGKKQTLFYASVPNSEDWVLSILIDNREIYKSTNELTMIIFIIFAIATLLSAQFARILSKSISNPIKELTDKMITVASSDNPINIEHNTKDEIVILENTYSAMLTELNDLSEHNVQIEKQKRKAEIRALQSQIQPHFLYNTLDTIQWQALDHNAMPVVNMTQLLSKFFRTSLSDGKEYITIEEEINHVDTYLQIQKVRYKDKINFHFEIDKSTLDLFQNEN